VAQRALDAEGRRALGLRVEDAGDADDGVGPEQHQRRVDIVEVDGAALDGLDDDLGQRTGVDLEADLEGLARGQAGADASLLFAGDRLVQAELAPQKSSLPKVSKRKIFLPSSSISLAFRSILFWKDCRGLAGPARRDCSRRRQAW
jgi:hypothetical protein